MLDNLYTLEQMARRIPEERLREAEQMRMIALARSRPRETGEPDEQADRRGSYNASPRPASLSMGWLRNRASSVLQMLGW
jgi:hypothetical protein